MSIPNPPQREAIRYLDGPLLVLAGAGSGKTRVITEKIAYLIESCGFSPSNIAAITFTNKAAREMQERVTRLLAGRPAKGLTISTFHALGVRILREEAKALGYKPNFSILDASDTFAIVSELAGSVDKGSIRKLQSLMSNWKSSLVSPDQARKDARNETETLAANAFTSYAATLRAYQAVDFDDLIALPVTLFEDHPEVRDKWQNRLRYLLIDEYQDTNAGQYRMLRLLAGPRAAFTAVGDDDQAIYGWRGADIENLRGLPRDYPNLKVIKLEQNYRSTVTMRSSTAATSRRARSNSFCATSASPTCCRADNPSSRRPRSRSVRGGACCRQRTLRQKLYAHTVLASRVLDPNPHGYRLRARSHCCLSSSPARTHRALSHRADAPRHLARTHL